MSNNSDNESHTSIITINRDKLKLLIVEWMALDEEIKNHKNIIKDMNDEKKQYETKILELMNILKEDTIITDKGNIIKSKRESKGSLTEDIIKSTLSEILKCQETAFNYTNILMEKRPIKEIINLKRKNFNKKK